MQAERVIRVLIVDGLAVDRAAVVRALGAERGVSIVGECGDLGAAAALAAEHGPQVVLFEPWPGGEEVLAAVAAWGGRARLLALSRSTSPRLMARLLRRGVLGLVPKAAELGELVHAIREVASGLEYRSALLDLEAVQDLRSLPPELDCDPLPTLTARERETIEAVVDGKANHEIAGRLSISSRTVEIHRANAHRKLHLHNLAHAVRYAILRGLGTR